METLNYHTDTDLRYSQDIQEAHNAIVRFLTEIQKRHGTGECIAICTALSKSSWGSEPSKIIHENNINVILTGVERAQMREIYRLVESIGESPEELQEMILNILSHLSNKLYEEMRASISTKRIVNERLMEILPR